EEITQHLNELKEGEDVMLKLTIPTKANLYKSLIDHPMVVRVVALSGGYSRDEANEKLKANDGLIASFSRALSQDLNADQTDEEFNSALEKAVNSIYEASVYNVYLKPEQRKLGFLYVNGRTPLSIISSGKSEKLIDRTSLPIISSGKNEKLIDRTPLPIISRGKKEKLIDRTPLSIIASEKEEKLIGRTD